MSGDPEKRCGIVALLGLPNAGKSTLLNRLVGQKIAIISPKPQTTRSIVRGIIIENNAQIIFVDTPGLFFPKKTLERAMVAAAWGGFSDADVGLLLVDAADRPGRLEHILAELKKLKHDKPVWLIVNKVDAEADKAKILPNVQNLSALFPFDKIFMISALTGDGVADLLKALPGMMPQSPWLYDEDQVTDMPQRLLAAEITREQLYLQLEQELPYAATVETDTWESFEDGTAKIMQTIYVARDGQKAIIIGHKGERLKAIGKAAREQMKQAFGHAVHLFLHIKVKEDWQERKEFYHSRGLDFKG